ncbi:MAG: phage portal protein, partial [Candidatus Methylomirabilales bacterium]
MDGDGKRPGFFRKVGALVNAPFERLALREEIARNERLQLAASSHILQEVVRRVEPEDDEFTQLLSGRDDDRSLDEATGENLRKAAVKASLKTLHLIGYLRSLQRFVFGQGPQLSVELEDERLKGRIMERWDLFRRLNDWDRVEDEIGWRTWRDGEIFLRKFVQRSGGPREFELDPKVRNRLAPLGVAERDLAPSGEIPAGMVFTRLIPPEQITDNEGIISHGIITDRNDVQLTLGYLWTPDGTNARDVIRADEMLHVAIRVDSDVKRGRSILEPLLKRAKHYEDWLEYRMLLNLVRSAVVLVKKVEGTASQVTAVRDVQLKQRESAVNDRKLRMLKGGTTVHAGPGVNYEFKTPNLQAQDAQHDGRSLLLNMAAGTGLPEYMFTGDASNANFA